MAAFNAAGTQTSLSDVRNYFITIGGSQQSAPYSLGSFYRGGAYVPDTISNSAVPTSGQLSISNLQGKWGWKVLTTTVSAGTASYTQVTSSDKNNTYYIDHYLKGWTTSNLGTLVGNYVIGSIGTSSYTTSQGTVTLYGAFRRRGRDVVVGANPSSNWWSYAIIEVYMTFYNSQYSGYGYPQEFLSRLISGQGVAHTSWNVSNVGGGISKFFAYDYTGSGSISDTSDVSGSTSFSYVG